MVLKIITVFALLIRGVHTDIKEDRIENPMILSGYVLAVIFAYLQSGVSGVIKSGIAAGMVILFLFPLFVIKGLGAGDIKLFSVLAAFFQKDVIYIIPLSFFVGGLIVVLLIITRWFKKIPVYKKNEKIHFSIPIMIGTWVWIICDILQEVI